MRNTIRSSYPQVVIWQAKRRAVLALAVGVLELLLRGFDLLAGSSEPVAPIVISYVVVVALGALIVSRHPRAAPAVLLVQSSIDVLAIFGAVAVLTAPAFYPRALLLALLVLQFTEVFVGMMPAVGLVVGSAAAYIALLAYAVHRGAPIAWGEELWLLALYVTVALNSVFMHARATRRLARMVELFGAAQRGDFSHAFEEHDDDEPDVISMLGRAYNHLRSELASMVMTDSLTRSLNRRGFAHELARAVANAERRSSELALLAIDIDHFKAINDTIGHLAGDEVLREMAELIAHHARAGDVVARVGGEEFVVLLPDADAEMAGVVAERIMSAIREHAFATMRGGQRVKVSVGIAVERVTELGMGNALRARADEALYVAKRLGRNRAVMWAPGIRSHATPPGSATAVPW